MSTAKRRHPRRRARALAALFTASLLTLVASAPAQGAEARNHPFLKALISGTEGSPPKARLEAPCGVAVGPEGEKSLFVSDYYRRAIFGISSLTDYFPDNGACALAADPFNLYANYWHGGVVNVTSGIISSAPATGIAVDPKTFDLYIDNRTSIAVYEAPVAPGDLPSFEIDPGPAGALEDGYGLAVSDFPATEGQIYVADAADHTVKVYDPKAPGPDLPIQEIDGASTPSGRFVSLVDASLAIDQSNGHLFVIDNTQPGAEHPLAAVVEFNAQGLYRGELEHAIIDGEPSGIAIDESETQTKGRLYVTSGNGSNIVIAPPAGPPAAELGAVYVFGPAGEGEILKASTSGAGQGTVTSSPAGIACPGACEAELNAGGIITLTATPAPGSAFAGWSGACTGTGACQVNLSAPASVDAEFVPAPAAFGAGSGAATARAATGGAAGAGQGEAFPAALGSRPNAANRLSPKQRQGRRCLRKYRAAQAHQEGEKMKKTRIKCGG
jgi:hypothetical protein